MQWPVFSFLESSLTHMWYGGDLEASSCTLEDSGRVECVVRFKEGVPPVGVIGSPEKSTASINEIREALFPQTLAPREPLPPIYPDTTFGNRKQEGKNSEKAKHFLGKKYF